MKKLLFALLSLVTFSIQAQVKLDLQTARKNRPTTVIVGVPNIFKIKTPVEVSVSNIKSTQGNIRMLSDGSVALYLHEKSTEPVHISFTQTKNAVEEEILYATSYVVKTIAELYGMHIGDYTQSGKASALKLKKNHAVRIDNADDMKDAVITFTLLHSSAQNADAKEIHYSSNDENAKKYYSTIMASLQENDKLFIENIVIKSSQGELKLGNMNFVLEK